MSKAKTLKGWKANYVDKLPAWVEPLGFEYIIRLRDDEKHIDTVGWRALIAGEMYGDFITIDPRDLILPTDLEVLDPTKAILFQQFEATYKRVNEQRASQQPDGRAGKETGKKTSAKIRKAKG